MINKIMKIKKIKNKNKNRPNLIKIQFQIPAVHITGVLVLSKVFNKTIL